MAAMDPETGFDVNVAAKWIAEAEAVLVCAGAGMSASPGEAVYVSPADFDRHYPFMKQYGYSTGYECMGLIGDQNAPIAAKWGYFASHYSNLRWNFKPNQGYHILQKLIGSRDHFVLTSNVDGCFERSGWNKELIYTPQGDASFYQCLSCCSPNSVFESKPIFDKLLPTINLQNGHVQQEDVPKCLNCGGPTFMNLRGGGWFLHSKYDQQNINFHSWVENILLLKKRLLIIEIGAGFNTPTITRFPVESIFRDSQKTNLKSSFIRINPNDFQIPNDFQNSISFQNGWEILFSIEKQYEHYFNHHSSSKNDKDIEKEEEGNDNDDNQKNDTNQLMLKNSLLEQEKIYLDRLHQNNRKTTSIASANFDWRKLLLQLRS